MYVLIYHNILFYLAYGSCVYIQTRTIDNFPTKPILMTMANGSVDDDGWPATVFQTPSSPSTLYVYV